MSAVLDVNVSAGLALVDNEPRSPESTSEYVELAAWHLTACQAAPIGSAIPLKQAHANAREMRSVDGIQPMLAGWSRFEDVMRSEHGRVHRPGQARLLCPKCREQAEQAAARA